MTLDNAGSQSFDNNFAKNIILLGVNNSSSSHSENWKNNFLLLGEVPTYGIDGGFESPGKKVQY